MTPREIVLRPNMQRYVNTAFTMSLSANELVQFISQQTGCRLEAYKETITRLRWLSSQQESITESLLRYDDDPAVETYLLALRTLSETLQAQVKGLETACTMAVLARRTMNTMEINGKFYALSITVRDFYETLRKISQQSA